MSAKRRRCEAASTAEPEPAAGAGAAEQQPSEQLPAGAARPRAQAAGAEFEDYSCTCESYDRNRRTPGLATLLGVLASRNCAGARRQPAPLASAEVLEIGCGTGNYLHVIKQASAPPALPLAARSGRRSPLPCSAQHVAHITGLDRNRAMLSRCRAKLAPAPDPHPSVSLQDGEADALPFPADSFDAVYACQVFHHFDPADSHAMARRVLREIQRSAGTPLSLAAFSRLLRPSVRDGSERGVVAQGSAAGRRGLPEHLHAVQHLRRPVVVAAHPGCHSPLPPALHRAGMAPRRLARALPVRPN